MIKISRKSRGEWSVKVFYEHDIEFVSSVFKLLMEVENVRFVDSTKGASAACPLPLAGSERPLPVQQDHKPDCVWLTIRSPQSPVPLP